MNITITKKFEFRFFSKKLLGKTIIFLNFITLTRKINKLIINIHFKAHQFRTR